MRKKGIAHARPIPYVIHTNMDSLRTSVFRIPHIAGRALRCPRNSFFVPPPRRCAFAKRSLGFIRAVAPSWTVREGLSVRLQAKKAFSSASPRRCAPPNRLPARNGVVLPQKTVFYSASVRWPVKKPSSEAYLSVFPRKSGSPRGRDTDFTGYHGKISPAASMALSNQAKPHSARFRGNSWNPCPCRCVGSLRFPPV